MTSAIREAAHDLLVSLLSEARDLVDAEDGVAADTSSAHGTSGVPDHAPVTGGESNAWLPLAIARSRASSAITHRAPHRALGEV